MILLMQLNFDVKYFLEKCLIVMQMRADVNRKLTHVRIASANSKSYPMPDYLIEGDMLQLNVNYMYSEI